MDGHEERKYRSSLVINTSHVDSRMKSNRWCLLGVVLVTEQLQLVDAALMDSLQGGVRLKNY
jgi:hypothetical protein